MLLVEDDPAVRELVSTVLGQQGYQVLQAANGHEALRLARQRSPGGIDLLVSDVVMPLMGGRELAERLAEIHPNVKVLHMSGYASDDLFVAVWRRRMSVSSGSPSHLGSWPEKSETPWTARRLHTWAPVLVGPTATGFDHN